MTDFTLRDWAVFEAAKTFERMEIGSPFGSKTASQIISECLSILNDRSKVITMSDKDSKYSRFIFKTESGGAVSIKYYQREDDMVELIDLFDVYAETDSYRIIAAYNNGAKERKISLMTYKFGSKVNK